MPDIEEIVVRNRNLPIVFELSVFNPRVPSPPPIVMSRCQVQVGSTLLDSATHPQYFDLTEPNYLTLKLWSAGLTVGRYPAKLYIFDDGHPLGLPFAEFVINVK